MNRTLIYYNYLFFKILFVPNKFFTVPIISDSTRPIVWKKYVNWFLNLHEFVYIVFTDMIYRPDSTLVIWRPLIVSWPLRNIFYFQTKMEFQDYKLENLGKLLKRHHNLNSDKQCRINSNKQQRANLNDNGVHYKSQKVRRYEYCQTSPLQQNLESICSVLPNPHNTFKTINKQINNYSRNSHYIY